MRAGGATAQALHAWPAARRWAAAAAIGVAVLPALAAESPPWPAASEDWPADTLDGRQLPIDLSFLNRPERPAGRHGRLRADGDRLVFADGTTARFWGTNLSAQALFGTLHEAVAQQARQLSRLGFNLVRLHHHDSWWTAPNIFGAAEPRDTRQLDPVMQERIDWWIKCLKDEGIYVWLDLHVQRGLRADDGIEAYDEIAKGRAGAELKGYNYVNGSIERAMQRFNAAYLGHVNPYTGRSLADEPAVAALLVTNENDLTQHFAHLLLPDKNVPWHTARYLARARAFAQAHDLPANEVWRSWQGGPALLFRNDLQHRFDAAMIDHLRSLGVTAPLATTSLWGRQMASLPALSGGDLIDVHAYEGPGLLDIDPRRAPTALDAAAAAQLVGKPLTVSEWNTVAFPAPDRQMLPMVVAAVGGHQGWDALLHYAWGQVPLQLAGAPSNWAAFNDPALLAALPAAALMYRQQHVREAGRSYLLAPSAAQLFDAPLEAGGTVAMRSAAGHGRLLTALPKVAVLPWLKPAAPPATAQVLHDPAEAVVPLDDGVLASDSGELRRDWRRGLYTIDTPRTQAALGRLAGQSVNLADVSLQLDTDQAAVAVQSLDGTPIARSRSLLISVATRSRPKPGGRLPFLTEPLRGVLRLRAAPGLALQGTADGSAAPAGVRLAARGPSYVLDFDGSAPVHWLSLRAMPASGPAADARP